jgi:tripartite-type tricarboxylate transporter receptor subunit TctC
VFPIAQGPWVGAWCSHARRSPLAPDIPTIAESDYPSFTIETYHVMISPAEISGPIAGLLERELRAALSRRDLVERFRLMDIVPLGLTGAAARQRIKDNTRGARLDARDDYQPT